MLFKIPVWSSDLSGWQVAWTRHGWDNNKTIRWQWNNPLPLVFMYHLCWSVWIGGETMWFRIFHVERCHSFVDSSADCLQALLLEHREKPVLSIKKEMHITILWTKILRQALWPFPPLVYWVHFKNAYPSPNRMINHPPFFFEEPVNHPVWWLKITKLLFPGLEPTEALKPLEYLYPMSYSLSLVAWGKRSPTSGPTVISVW